MPRTPLGRTGQTIVEYTVVFIIILGVMIAMKDYLKRGIQGRWKSASDDFGQQYDPQYINSNTMYSTQVNSQSVVSVEPGDYTPAGGVGQQGQWTSRLDTSNSLDTKTGFSQVGS
jgi:Flp pilus assembly pilin Flp